MTINRAATALLVTALFPAGATSISVLAAAPNAGIISGRVRLTGKPHGNPVIRMAVDPMCRKAAGGARRFNEIVLTDHDGGLANVFVKLQGTFPRTPVPPAPVTIDQRACTYIPRVVGARIGQVLEARNSDPLLHNVHSHSIGANTFNVGQPVAGLVFRVPLKAETGMLRISCDVHRWMTTYVGVVDHPYFAVTGRDGRFTIAGVPTGTYTLVSWHERYG